MENKVHQALFRALTKVLRPVVRIFLRNGVAYGQFAEVTKQVFIDIADEEFKPSRRKQSDSHIAVVTGLTRKEVRRLRQARRGNEEKASYEKYNRATRVISGWMNDPRFQDDNGRPAVLPLDGSAQSFDELVRAYSGDMKTIAMLDALEQAGTIRREGDRIHLVEHAYIPGSDPVDKIEILGNDSNELLSTIDHNLTALAGKRRFQRKASNTRIAADRSHLIHELLKEKGQGLLEEIDARLSELEVPTSENSDCKTVSVGIYFYESPGKGED